MCTVKSNVLIIVFLCSSDFPDEIDSFTIEICNGAKRAKPTPVCRTSVLLDRLTNGSVSDEWYPLISAANQSKSTEMGSIRARAQFISETLMPIEEYSPLKEVGSLKIIGDTFTFVVFNMSEVLK